MGVHRVVERATAESTCPHQTAPKIIDFAWTFACIVLEVYPCLGESHPLRSARTNWCLSSCSKKGPAMGGHDSAEAEDRAWWQNYSQRRFGILLVVLSVVLAGPPVLFEFGLSMFWFDALMALVVLAAIQSLCFERRQR